MWETVSRGAIVANIWPLRHSGRARLMLIWPTGRKAEGQLLWQENGHQECSCVFLSSGSLYGCLSTALGFETIENKTFVRMYGFEGEPSREGERRDGRGSRNQVIAEKVESRESLLPGSRGTVICVPTGWSDRATTTGRTLKAAWHTDIDFCKLLVVHGVQRQPSSLSTMAWRFTNVHAVHHDTAGAR